MLVSKLVELLLLFPQGYECRIAACTELPAFDETPSYDLPIAGLSTAFEPGTHVPLDVPKEKQVVWIVGSVKLPLPKHE